MHQIDPARLKPGVTLESLPDRSADTAGRQQDDVIRGKALVFWDPMSLPGTKFAKKLNAIDTDQITPATDCVSESLETLDEKWKAGSFRHLMPDFRARVHRGENFIIAGDRFAIGSSREMSPAGLKGVAEEAGLEMVVVCGQNMGDIFRRNSFNLGLHVVQSPEAVADARDGDAFSFDPVTRRLTNDTQGKTYEPVPLSEKEEEIRRSGGIFAVGRREFRTSVLTKPSVDWPDEEDARRLTTTEQILWAHRVDKDLKARDLKPGMTLRVYADLLPPPMAPRHLPSTRSTRSPAAPRSIRGRRRSPTITSCSPASTPTTSRQASAASSRARHGIEKPYYATPGDGIFHFYFPEQGLVDARAVHPGSRLAQPRLRRVRRGRHRRRIDDARVRVVHGVHLRHAREAAPRRLQRDSCSRGSAARTSSSSCCGGGARSSRRGCRSSSWTRTGSCRSHTATRSRT